eukprot:1479910-Rhodomonas_salina.2
MQNETWEAPPCTFDPPADVVHDAMTNKTKHPALNLSINPVDSFQLPVWAELNETHSQKPSFVKPLPPRVLRFNAIPSMCSCACCRVAALQHGLSSYLGA